MGATIAGLVAALVVLVVSANTLIAITSTSYSWTFGARWLIFLPGPSSADAFKLEMGFLIAFAVGAIITALTRTFAARIASGMLAAVVVIIVVVNSVSASTGHVSATYILSQSNATATWICIVLSAGTGLAGILGLAKLSTFAAGLVAGAIVTGGAAVGVVASAPANLLTGLGQTTVSGTTTGGSPQDNIPSVDAESDNQPGNCAGGWSTLLDVRTSDITATVCSASEGTFLIASLADGSTINVPATAAGAGWTGSYGSSAYHVDPNVVAIYVDGALTSDEATDNATSSQQEDPFAELADLVQIAHDGRVKVVQLSNLTGGCGSESDAQSLISQVSSNRSQLVSAVQRLQNSATTSDLPIGPFLQSMQYSLDADQSWGNWISNTWSPWVEDGCSGPVQRDGDSDYDAFISSSEQATSAKNAFVAAYDPMAGQHDQKDDWQGSDI